LYTCIAIPTIPADGACDLDQLMKIQQSAEDAGRGLTDDEREHVGAVKFL